MNDKAERNKKILMLVIIISVIFVGVYELFFRKEKIEEEKIDTETISVVQDNSKFYTVSSCVTKYLNYLSSGETDKLIILLSEEYKKDNSINSSNLYEFIGKFSGLNTFSPKKMFVQRLSENVYKYYVKGFIQEESIDAIGLNNDFYIVVILDEKNMTFAIEPYDGSLFD